MSRVLVVGGSGWANAGDDLIALRLIERERARGNTVRLAGGPHPVAGLPKGLVRVPVDGTVRARLALLATVLWADELLIGGGGLLDDRVAHFYRPFYRLARVAYLLRRPFHIVAVGIGPIRRPGTGVAYAWMLDRAASASVRDSESQQRAISAGVDRAPVIEPDPVLWGSPGIEPPPLSYDLLVNLRPWGHQPGTWEGVDLSEVVRSMSEVLNRCPQQRIGLVSMSQLDGDRDAVVLEELAGLLRGHEIDRLYAVAACEMDRVVASSRSVISMRLHLGLLGVRHGTAVAAIAYDPKVEQQARAHGFTCLSMEEARSSEILERACRQSGVLPWPLSHPS